MNSCLKLCKLIASSTLLLGALFPFLPALSQTASVGALVDQACMGTRAGRNLGCTANDFTASASFTQPAGSTITSCTAGQSINLDVISSITSGSPNRFAAGIFFGQVGNLPSINNAANLCSLGVFPNLPPPFAILDGGVNCGDFLGNSSATLQVSNIKVSCTPAPGTNQLSIPYAVAWDNQAAPLCTPANLTASTNSKCIENGGGFVAGVTVQGYIKITKQTNPSTSTQTFTFTTSSSPTTTVTSGSFTLSSGGSQTVTFPINATATQQITVTEALAAGWESNANIVCTSPTGGSATYVTVNNANRTITGDFNGTNFGALCTITNNKQTRVRASKSVPNGDTGTFNLSVQTSLGTTTASVGNGGSTIYQQSVSGSSVTVAETSGAGSSITKYITSVSCLNDDTGSPVSPAPTVVLTGNTRTAVFTPPSNVDTSCTFTNTRSANVTLSKTNGVTSVISGASTTYAITVANSGVSDADGSVLKDPAVPGLSCVNPLACSSSGGAVCPGGITVAALQGAGITLTSLPANSSLTFSLVCNVTASGQ